MRVKYVLNASPKTLYIFLDYDNKRKTDMNDLKKAPLEP